MQHKKNYRIEGKIQNNSFRIGWKWVRYMKHKYYRRWCMNNPILIHLSSCKVNSIQYSSNVINIGKKLNDSDESYKISWGVIAA
jgi:hypothetical protein